MNTATHHTVIVGGGSGIGLGLAERLLAAGGEVTIVGRTPARLDEAVSRLGGASETLHASTADVSQEQDVVALAAKLGSIDHVVTTAADVSGSYVPIGSLDLAVARRVIDSKLIGPILLAKHLAALIKPGGSLTFTSGINAYRPTLNSAITSAVNGSLQSFAFALAIELAPVRVNVISPGWVETDIWQQLGPGAIERRSATAERLPAGRIGQPADLAKAYVSVMENGYMTGTVLHVDGGHRLM